MIKEVESQKTSDLGGRRKFMHGNHQAANLGVTYFERDETG